MIPTTFDEFLNEAVQSSMDLETANKLINGLSDGYAKLMAADDEGVHIYIKPSSANKFYDTVTASNGFYIDIWRLKNLAKTPLGDSVYVIIKTYDYKDTTKRINDLWGHAIAPIITDQGMFFNSPKEAKDYIRKIKTGSTDNIKKVKYTVGTLSDFVKQAQELEDRYVGGIIGWRIKDLSFVGNSRF